jgi:hypothetical protein
MIFNNAHENVFDFLIKKFEKIWGIILESQFEKEEKKIKSIIQDKSKSFNS